MLKLKRIRYKEDLNARQKENFNFQKVASTLADYGFNCIRLSDDWQGADFIACHIDGNTFVKIQLKGALTFEKNSTARIFSLHLEKMGNAIYTHMMNFKRNSFASD